MFQSGNLDTKDENLIRSMIVIKIFLNKKDKTSVIGRLLDKINVKNELAYIFSLQILTEVTFLLHRVLFFNGYRNKNYDLVIKLFTNS